MLTPLPINLGLESLSSPDGAYWSYADWSDSRSFEDAMTQLDSYIAAEGPFDAVMGFSNGASLAVMHIVHKAQQAKAMSACQSERREGPIVSTASNNSAASPAEQPPFKLAVLFSCTAAFDPEAYYSRGEVQALDFHRVGELIAIPTVHIWGCNDPRKAESEQVHHLCRPDLRSMYVHDGGHEVPGLGVKAGLASSVKVVRRGFTMASMAEEEEREREEEAARRR